MVWEFVYPTSERLYTSYRGLICQTRLLPSKQPAGNMTVMKRDHLLSSLRGQRLEVDNLNPIFSHWPAHQNPNYEGLIPEVQNKLERQKAPNMWPRNLLTEYSLIEDPGKLDKLKAADFALFAARWWPNSPAEELRILAFLSIWLFIWDDEIDESAGSLNNDYDAAQRFRRETVLFLEQCLDLQTPYAPHVVPESPIVQSFDVIGEALRGAYDTSTSLLICEYLFTDTFFGPSTTVHGRDGVLHGNVRRGTATKIECWNTINWRLLDMSNGYKCGECDYYHVWVCIIELKHVPLVV